MNEILLVLLIAGVGAIFLKLNEIGGHLESIRNLLRSVEGRLDNEAFVDRMHKITVSAEESAKCLKSIEERIEPFTETRLHRLFADIRRAVGMTDSSEKKYD